MNAKGQCAAVAFFVPCLSSDNRWKVTGDGVSPDRRKPKNVWGELRRRRYRPDAESIGWPSIPGSLPVIRRGLWPNRQAVGLGGVECLVPSLVA